MKREIKDLKNCGVMKFLADIPSCLEGEDHGINEV
jgi:hypothetical protein